MNPSTRSSLIRLAYEKPELREKILPLIKHSGDKAKTEEGAKKLFDKYMEGLTEEGRKNTKKKPQDFYEKPTEDSDSGEDRAKEIDKELYEEAEKKKKELPSKIEDAYFAWRDAETAYEEASKSKKSELKTKMDKAKQKHDDLEEELKQAEVDLDSYKKEKKASLRTRIIRLAHTKPELRKHLLPLIKKEGGSVNMKVSEGYPYIRYRIENEGLPTARCMVVFTYRVSKKSTVAQSLISDLNEFKKQCFSMTKSLESLFRSRNLGSLDFKEDFVRVELATPYPLLGKYTAYFNIDSDAFNDSVEQMRAILEKGFGATDIRS